MELTAIIVGGAFGLLGVALGHWLTARDQRAAAERAEKQSEVQAFRELRARRAEGLHEVLNRLALFATAPTDEDTMFGHDAAVVDAFADDISAMGAHMPAAVAEAGAGAALARALRELSEAYDGLAEDDYRADSEWRAKIDDATSTMMGAIDVLRDATDEYVVRGAVQPRSARGPE